jgi:aldehyde dehydrogenase (NAD+)
LISTLKKEFTRLLGPNPRESKHFVRIVNERAFDRLVGYIQGADVVMGGEYDRSERYISPTIIDHVDVNSPIMKEEIFGPIFPVVTFQSTDEAIRFVTDREKPLALYYFGCECKAQKVLRHTSSGGACINDTIMHIANENLPFGGVGNSGLGTYHGKLSYDVFSHYRSVVYCVFFYRPVHMTGRQFFPIWVISLLILSSRNGDYSPNPSQIRTCGFPAYGSSQS